MDAFFAWDVHLKSPVLAILADTLLSVNLCQQKQGKVIQCYASLLYNYINKEVVARSSRRLDQEARNFGGLR